MIRHSPLSPYIWDIRVDIGSYTPFLQFTPTTSCIIAPTTLEVISQQSLPQPNTNIHPEGAPTEHRNQAKIPLETKSFTYAPGLTTPS